jgi:hypothetical protein
MVLKLAAGQGAAGADGEAFLRFYYSFQTDMFVWAISTWWMYKKYRYAVLAWPCLKSGLDEAEKVDSR